MHIDMYAKAAQFIERRISITPKTGLILGSGLGVLANEIEAKHVIPYGDIPGFTVSTVAGHAGQLVAGTLEGKAVVAMQGRFHLYEGYDLEQVTFPVRVMRQLGVEKLIVTNASGGITQSFQPGELMIIDDHINLTGRNPLVGPNNDQIGPRFPDMSTAYDLELRNIADKCAQELGIHAQHGVYAGLLGPSYETPAEIRMLRTLGADAVGMSTVPEVITAVHSGMRVLGISCISNMAAGILDQPLSHAEVMETAENVRDTFLTLVRRILSELE